MTKPTAKSNLTLPNRSEGGMSLASVLAMGVVITLFVTALLNTMMPVLQKTARFKHQSTVRSYAELGLDYALHQMNTKASGANCASTPTGIVTYTVPANVMGDPQASASVTIATLPAYETWLINQQKLQNPEISAGDAGIPPATSILRDTTLAAQYPNSYRMISVTAQYGRATSTIRSLLQPVISSTSLPSFPYGVFGVASVVYAGQAGFNSYNSADPRIAAEGGTLGKISQVYGGGGLTRSIVQGGSHYEYPDPQSFYGQMFNQVGGTYNATPAASAPWMTMTGNVYSNGYNTAYGSVTGPNDTKTSAFHTGTKADPAHNVFGIKNGIYPDNIIPDGTKNGWVPQSSKGWTGANPSKNSWNPGPLNTNGVTYPQPPIPETPNAVPGTPNLGALNISGGTVIFDHTASAPTKSIGTVKSGQVVRLPPGDWALNTLSVTNGGSIQIASGTQAAIAAGSQPPVALHMMGSNNGSVVVNIDNTSSINMTGITDPVNVGNGFNTSGNLGVKNSSGKSMLASNQIAITPPGGSGVITETSGSAAQLQMYYNGNSFNKSNSTYNTHVILSGNERMTLYAPNAGVLIGSGSVGSGGPSQINRDANFYGALVGGSVGINSNYSSGKGVFVHYDYALSKSGRGLGSAAERAEAIAEQPRPMNPWAPPSPMVYAGEHAAYRAVSWQESNENGRFAGQ